VAGQPALKVNLGGIRRGMYVVKVADGQDEFTGKVVVD